MSDRHGFGAELSHFNLSVVFVSASGTIQGLEGATTSPTSHTLKDTLDRASAQAIRSNK